MRFTILTIFPEAFSYLDQSILGKAQEKWLIDIKVVDIRKYSNDKHKKVDNIPYGWGQWMVMTCQPIFDAIEDIKSRSKQNKHYVIFVSPWSNNFSQNKAYKFSEMKDTEIIIICWRYEWIDQRIIDELVDEEISVWPYILSWWELPAMLIVDSVARLIDWVIWKEESHMEETYSAKLDWKKEFPYYTRPQDFKWLTVPEVLLWWDHKKIEQWKKKMLRDCY